MNLFFLDFDPKKCAEYHCDKHVVKMILELCQLMYTAHRSLGSDIPEDGYRSFNPQHPTCIWVRSSVENYVYTFKLCKCLCEEYTHRYFRIHKCESHLSFLETVPCFEVLNKNYKVDQVFSSNKHFENNGNTPIPLAMPVEYTRKDTIQSYRNYYKSKKSFVQWTNRPVPSWFTFVNIFR